MTQLQSLHMLKGGERFLGKIHAFIKPSVSVGKRKGLRHTDSQGRPVNFKELISTYVTCGNDNSLIKTLSVQHRRVNQWGRILAETEIQMNSGAVHAFWKRGPPQ